MKILLIEDDVHLLQSLTNKLNDFYLENDCAQRLSELPSDKEYDVVVASFLTIEGNYQELLKLYGNAIIILSVLYISDDTVSKPLKSGITDYLLKPFKSDEFMRKILHYKSYKDLKKEVEFYRNYFNFIERYLDINVATDLKPPFIIRANSQRVADIYAMFYSRQKNIKFEFLRLKEENWKQLFNVNTPRDKFFYITNLEELRRNELKEFLDILINNKCVVSFLSNEDIEFPNIINVSGESKHVDFSGDVMSIKDYEQFVITRFESRYNDVELARKLGISRKSLWEKRKKYGILHKKRMKK